MPINEREGELGFQRVGVIDIGSNSVRFMMYELFGSAFTPIYNEKVLAGLGRDLSNTGKLHPDGADRAFTALRRFKYIVDAQGVTNILIAATAALRDASDAKVFIDKVREEIGFDIKPLSGEQEAHISTLGVLSGDARAYGIAADLGGASLELTSIAGGQPADGKTYPLGPFSVYEGAFDTKAASQKLEAFLGNGALDGLAKNQPLYLIGGAWRNLGLIHQARTEYPLKIAHNYQISTDDAKGLGMWASGDGAEELVVWPRISSRRAETLPYAGLLLSVLVDQLEPSTVIIAPGGLREGLVFDAFPEKIKARNSLFDACRDLARGRTQGTMFGRPLIDFLEGIDTHLPSVFDRDNEKRLRNAACYLVGIGKGLHPDHRASMAFKTVLYAPLPSLTHKERAYLALMLYGSYTSKVSVPNLKAIEYLLNEEERHAARVYGEAMRFGVVLSGHSGVVLARQNLNLNGDTLELHVSSDFDGLIVERCLLRLNSFATKAGFKVSNAKI